MCNDVDKSISTFFCREHGCYGAERAFPSVVERSHFDIEGRERRDGVIAENVTGEAGRRHHGARPRDRAHRTEGDDVTEALSVLQLLWNRLRVEHKTIVILKHIEANIPTDPTGLK